MISDDAMIAALDEGFQKRVRYFLTKAAVGILYEAETTDNHFKRAVFAKQILNNQQNVVDYAVAVMTNGALASTSVGQSTPDFGITDGDLEFTVNSLIGAFTA